MNTTRKLLLLCLGLATPSMGLLDNGQAADYEIPVDVADAGSASSYYDFAWDSFVALSWPATVGSERGKPDQAKSLGALGTNGLPLTTVWETYKEKIETFPGTSTNPVAPGNWNAPEGNFGFADLGAGEKLLVRGGKGTHPDEVASAYTQATYHSLWDVRGNFIRYEIRINRTAFEYFKASGYYDARRQIEDDFNLVLPPYGYTELKQNYPTVPDFPTRDQHGVILLKASWRILDGLPEIVQSRYYRRQGRVLLPNGDLSGVHLLGMVGFHIVRSTDKTKSTWFWSTFEHVDNVTLDQYTNGLPADLTATLNPGAMSNPWAGDVASHPGVWWADPDNQPDPPNLTYGLHNLYFGPKGIAYTYPGANDTKLEDDLLDELNIDRQATNALAQLKTKLAGYQLHVSRINDIPPAIRRANQQRKTQLGDTFWKYYELVGVTYPAIPGEPYRTMPALPSIRDEAAKVKLLADTNAIGAAIKSFVTTIPSPIRLNAQTVANTTMETYLQTISCLDCHNGTARTPATAADLAYINQYGPRTFTFLHQRGPVNINQSLIQPPAK